MAAAAPEVESGSLESSAYTNASAAHVTLTNTGRATQFECFQAVVTAVSGKSKPVRSVTVCSGDLKPHTTIALEAPYSAGAVNKICDGPPGAYGIRSIDWDLCTFELEEQKAP